MTATGTIPDPSHRDIQVLLATYKGERFLREQIDSCFGQTWPGVRILARDDHSPDGTRDILEEYARRFPTRFSVLPADDSSGGAKWNFARLLAASDAPYVALADQDDVWRPDKLQRSMDAMIALEQQHGEASPLLVFTDLEVVGRDLAPVSPSFWANQNIEPERISTLHFLLAQNVLTGCTALMNRALVLRSLEMPEEAFMHDWWIALMASIFGHAIALPYPSVQYRQHGGNVVGATQHRRPNLVPRWRAHSERRAQWEMCVQQARGLLRTCGEDMPAKHRRTVESMIRVEETPGAALRAARFLRGGFFQKGLRPNLAILWYLLDMKAAKRADAPDTNAAGVR